MGESLRDELAEAEALVANLKQRIALASCIEVGHDWQHTGGCNAGCDGDCICSVPVHMCAKCGDCDYGDNDEARLIRQRCLERREAERG
jgi:hypothetical protein